MEVHGMDAGEWRYHDSIDLSVLQVLGREPCGDAGEMRCRLVPVAEAEAGNSSDSEAEELEQEERRA
eukprot:297763-Prymnesium_polylepis.1